MKESERSELCSRRSILRGSAMLLVGGLAGRVSSAYGVPEPVAEKAALPLPWKWAKLDPLEAGRRAYKFYLTRKG
jgi:hypothetical protein